MFSRHFFRLAGLFLLLLIPAITLQSQTLSAATLRAVTMYELPASNSAVTGQLDPESIVTVEGRDALPLWVRVQTLNNLEGWIEASALEFDDSAMLRELPVLTNEPPVLDVSTLSSDPEVLAILERLRTTPIFYNLNTPQVQEIFHRGQSLGNHPEVFTKIGDSNTTNGDFLRPMGYGYCQLGSYAYLQTTIDYFRTFHFRDGSNSFTRYSKAAYEGFSSSAALDSMWSYRPCKLNETPVECEYRLTQASTVIIMLGLMDVRYETDAQFYRENMERVVQSLTGNGVIPVLTTIIVLPDQAQLSFDTSVRINGVLLDLAEQYQIPFLNLWMAVQTLPDYGIGPDRTHLKQVRGKFCTFDGSEQAIGGTLRNLLSLQLLDELRRNVFVGGEN